MIRLRLAPLTRPLFPGLGLLVFVSSGLAAATAPNQFNIRDHSQPYVFEVADNELMVRTPAHQETLQTIEAQGSIAAIQQRASELRAATGNEVELVLYETGVPHDETHRRVLTKQVLVQLELGQDAQTIATATGASGWGPTILPDHFIFTTAETGGALSLTESLRTQPGVLSAEPLLARKQIKRMIPTDTLFANQWHLRNTGQNGGTAGVDVNITTAWNNYQGTGIRLAIVDDGLQYTHPDLQPNYDSTISTNLNSHTADPSPDVSADFHGSSCAGVAAGRGTNGLGVVGSAFLANLGGIRLIGAANTDADEAAAMAYRNDVIHLKSNSWGPADDGRTLEGPGTLAAAALAQGVQTGRGGKGIIYVWAGGNGLQALDNANYDGYANSIYTIAIAAITDQGNQASYSESGACLVVGAPSSSTGRQGITTTDLVGENGYNYTGASGELADKNYTQTFGGTSSATPLATGVIALILQANPNLGWRDVQEILMKSATKNAAADTDWYTNSAGFKFNHKFGAGLINAGAAISLATNWVNLGAQTNINFTQSPLSVAIPDNNTGGITNTFAISNSNIRVEHVTVTASITHTYRGDLAITLISPSGTQSRLAEKHNDPGDNYASWKFMTVRNWGESANGTWTVKIVDTAAQDTGTLTSLRLDIFGSTGSAAATGADLVVTNISSPNPVVAGDILTYALSVQNKGPTNATAVTLTDVLPAGATFVSAIPSQGSAINTGTNILCNLGSLASNATATVTVKVVPNQAGSVTNISSVTSAQSDSVTANNTNIDVTTVSPQIFNVAAQARPTSAIITWNTQTNTTGRVEYGSTTNYGSLSPLDSSLVTGHGALLIGLTPGTNYYYGIIAQVGTNTIHSGPYSFSSDLTLIVDNPQATYSGTWTLGTSLGDKYGTYYQTAFSINSPSASSLATYSPNFTLAAKYDVALWYPSGGARSTNVPVTIFNGSGSVPYFVNQTVGAGSWQVFATGVDFAPAQGSFAAIGNNTGETSKTVYADAVRWTYNLAQDNPPAGNVPAWWANFYFGSNVDGNLDPDGDGISTYAEYIAGTEPTNSASKLTVSSERTPPGLKIKFSPVQGGRIYELVTTTNLLTGSWTTLSNLPVVTLSEGEFNITNSPAIGPRFYRLGVHLAP